MRNKKFLISIGFLLFAQQGISKAKYGMAGCGLGSVIIGAEGGQLSAATTNGTGFNQGLGITSGTSNCMEAEDMAALEAQEEFVVENYMELAKDVSKGEGVYMEGLAQTFGCDAEAYSNFAQVINQDKAEILEAPGSVAFLNTVRSKLKEDPTVSQNCSELL